MEGRGDIALKVEAASRTKARLAEVLAMFSEQMNKQIFVMTVNMYLYIARHRLIGARGLQACTQVRT